MLALYQQQFQSRFLLGTAGYPSFEVMRQAILNAESDIVTVSLKRELHQEGNNQFWQSLKDLNKNILPNTAGCFYAKDAVTTAQMAREIFATDWIKLEVIGDQYTLQPDPFELLTAAKALNKLGFKVFPYCTDDLILCKRLLDAGCEVLMPWAAPIGSGKGIINAQHLQTLRARLPKVPLIIDAGIGKPSDAAKAMELGFDAVLLNTAVSQAQDPIKMAGAFRQAVNAGRLAYEAGIMAEREHARPSTPVLDTPFWHQGAEQND